MSFFKKGAEGRKENERYEAAAKKRAEDQKNTPREFFLPLGGKSRIMFLDDPDFFLKRHGVKINGRWDSLTCIEDIDDCPACLSGNNNRMVLACTILTMTEYVSKQSGKKYKYMKNLLVVGGDAKTHLLSMLQKRKTLKHAIVEVSRGTQAKSPAIGAYDYEGKLPKEQWDKFLQVLPQYIKANTEQDIPVMKYLAPYDYEKVFAPLPKGEIARMFGMTDTKAYGSDDDFHCDTDLDTTSLDTGSTEEDSIDEFSAEASDESPFGATSLDAELGTSAESEESVEYDIETLRAKAISFGMRKPVAAKKPAEELKKFIAENETPEDDEEDSESLEDKTDEELSAILTGFGMSKKKILLMDREAMIEAITDLRAEED